MGTWRGVEFDSRFSRQSERVRERLTMAPGVDSTTAAVTPPLGGQPRRVFFSADGQPSRGSAKADRPNGVLHDAPREIVGVIGDLGQDRYQTGPQPQMYVPRTQLPRRMDMTMSWISVALSVIGSLGVMAHAVNQRTNEIGIRGPGRAVRLLPEL
jgi:hypothetical protein